MTTWPTVASHDRAQQIHNVVTALWEGRNVVQPINNVVVALMPQRQNCRIAPKLPQHCVVNLTHGVLWMLYWQRWCNVEIATSNLKCLHNLNTTTSNSQRCTTNVTSKLDSKFTSQHIMDVPMAMSIQLCNHNIKFVTSSRSRYYAVELMLRQLSKEYKI